MFFCPSDRNSNTYSFFSNEQASTNTDIREPIDIWYEMCVLVLLFFRREPHEPWDPIYTKLAIVRGNRCLLAIHVPDRKRESNSRKTGSCR